MTDPSTEQYIIDTILNGVFGNEGVKWLNENRQLGEAQELIRPLVPVVVEWGKELQDLNTTLEEEDAINGAGPKGISDSPKLKETEK